MTVLSSFIMLSALTVAKSQERYDVLVTRVSYGHHGEDPRAGLAMELRRILQVR